MRITKKFGVALVATATALTMSACGSDDSEESTPPPASTEETPEPEPEPEPSEDMTTSEEPSAEPSEPMADPSDDATDAGPVDQAYCDAIIAAGEDLQALSGLTDPESLDAESAQQAADSFSDIAAAAPAEAADSWTALGDVMQAVADADGDIQAIDPADLDIEAVGEAQSVITDSVQQCAGG